MNELNGLLIRGLFHTSARSASYFFFKCFKHILNSEKILSAVEEDDKPSIVFVSFLPHNKLLYDFSGFTLWITFDLNILDLAIRMSLF